MALNVRFPQVNEGNPTLDILDANGVSLGAKPIRDVNGAALTANHLAANVRAELYYVDHGGGYWVLGAGGARGEPGPAGPPDGEFYIISGTTQLGFRDTGRHADPQFRADRAELAGQLRLGHDLQLSRPRALRLVPLSAYRPCRDDGNGGDGCGGLAAHGAGSGGRL